MYESYDTLSLTLKVTFKAGTGREQQPMQLYHLLDLDVSDNSQKIGIHFNKDKLKNLLNNTNPKDQV